MVPKSLVNEVLSLCHDNICAGHPGIARTLVLVRRAFYWYSQRRDVVSYVKSCAICIQTKSPSRKARAPMEAFQAGNPMERVHIDMIGPFPLSKDGNRYVLMVIDQFTRWVECLPLPDQAAITVAKVLVEDFFCRFGIPLELHSDQGSNFMSQLFKELCEKFEIRQTRTTPYHPSGNGQVERQNRTLLQLIRAYIGKFQDSWDENLPLLGCAIRSSLNRSTGYSPNQMMLGRELFLPAEVTFGLAEVNRESLSHDDY